jgi:hypothetical protein
MNFPGFTAEESLKRSDRYYVQNIGSTTILGNTLMSAAQASIVTEPVAGVGRVVLSGFGDIIGIGGHMACEALCGLKCGADSDCLQSCKSKC